MPRTASPLSLFFKRNILFWTEKLSSAKDGTFSPPTAPEGWEHGWSSDARLFLSSAGVKAGKWSTEALRVTDTFVNRQNAVSLFRFLVAWKQYNYFKNLLKLSFWKFEAKCCFHTSWGRQLNRFLRRPVSRASKYLPLMASPSLEQLLIHKALLPCPSFAPLGAA